jgi:hypothetical protein
LPLPSGYWGIKEVACGVDDLLVLGDGDRERRLGADGIRLSLGSGILGVQDVLVDGAGETDKRLWGFWSEGGGVGGCTLVVASHLPSTFPSGSIRASVLFISGSICSFTSCSEPTDDKGFYGLKVNIR